MFGDGRVGAKNLDEKQNFWMLQVPTGTKDPSLGVI